MLECHYAYSEIASAPRISPDIARTSRRRAAITTGHYPLVSYSVERRLADDSILQRVGNTPLVRLSRITRGLAGRVEILAKCEWFNPGGSVKDRPALRMILEAERSGELTPNKIILDSTSGNTGIAYAMIGAARGYCVELVVPSNVSEERKRILNAYGAEIVFTDGLEGSDGAIREARRRYAENPGRYYMPDQYNNPDNWRAHYDTTGPEIIAQTEGRVTHFVAAIGTSGTLVGTGRRLKDFRPAIKVIAAEPARPMHGIEGLKHMATSIVPGIYDPSVHDEKVPVDTEAAYAMARRLAREEGLLVGQSAGAAMVAALEVARRADRAVVVTVFPDNGDKYLTTALWR
ncbi:MAG: cysteine synthase [Chloroflexi bacterium]|nr:cysteine synthase [Chloroflexota bacterium]MBI4506737.1 cysteine synthase [Chloroflexota bacterium]